MQRSLSFATILVLAALPVALRAQQSSGAEDERMAALVARNAAAEQWFGPKNKVTIGFRVLASGGNVNFGNLGAITPLTVPAASEGNVTRTYDDGQVASDAFRANETDANGFPSQIVGDRYYTFTSADGTTRQVGDYLRYISGQTRNWTAAVASQFDEKPGQVGFSTYSAVSEGGSYKDKMGASAGIELQFNRDFGRITRRIQWGIMGGITLNSINSKAAGEVTSTLVKHTDYYQLLGSLGDIASITFPLTQPTLPAADSGTGIQTETTVPLSQTPVGSSDGTTPGGATINGRWQVRGAYFMFKLGPSFRAQFSDRWELTGSAGFAAAYAGTEYTATESMTVAVLGDRIVGLSDPQTSSTTKFLPGYYADLTLEWNANEVTGIFAGLSAQKLDAYDQLVASRTARVDLGSTAGIRGGITVKF